MGNCYGTRKKSASEIAPTDLVTGSPVVRLFGSPNSMATSFLRFALMYKPVSLQFVPAGATDLGSETPVIQFESDLVSGSVETLLRYVDSRFPEPRLAGNVGRCYDETTPLVVWVVTLQHRSLTWHLERMVRWADDLATRGGRTTGDPVMGSSRMEVRKLGRSYSQLLELMLEHAQMEELVIFPILEMADKGLCETANEEHSKALPIMNGIKEDMKSIGVLDSGSPVYQEALFDLSARLKLLQDHSRKHFEEEEKGVLPLMEAAEMSRKQQERVLDQCLEVMAGTHSHLFRFFVEGLLPQDAMQYLDLITRCGDKDRVSSMFDVIIDKDRLSSMFKRMLD